MGADAGGWRACCFSLKHERITPESVCEHEVRAAGPIVAPRSPTVQPRLPTRSQCLIRADPAQLDDLTAYPTRPGVAHMVDQRRARAPRRVHCACCSADEIVAPGQDGRARASREGNMRVAPRDYDVSGTCEYRIPGSLSDLSGRQVRAWGVSERRKAWRHGLKCRRGALERRLRGRQAPRPLMVSWSQGGTIKGHQVRKGARGGNATDAS